MNKVIALYCLTSLVSLGIQAQMLRSYSMVSLMNGQSDFITPENELINLPIWGYGPNNGANTISIPGPTIYANQGDSVHLELLNPSMEGHTIHLHGLDVDEANDGVPHHTGFIQQGDSFTYRFKATHAGNFLYHCHVTTTMHLTLGMYGMVIIYPSDSSNRIYDNGPTYDRQFPLLLSDMDARWNEDYTKIGGFLTYDPDLLLINGKNRSLLFADSNVNMIGAEGDQLLMRLLNVGYRVNRVVFPEEIKAVVHTSDGRVLDSPFETDTLLLYPGERYSVLAEVLDSIPSYVAIDYLDPYRLLHLGREYIPINDTAFEYIPYIEADTNTDTSGVGQREIGFSDMVLFPNPAFQNAWIDVGSKTIQEVEIYDIGGRSLKKYKNQGSTSKMQLELSDLTEGVLLIKVTTTDHYTQVMKLVRVSNLNK